jgi:hypothetical protein
MADKYVLNQGGNNPIIGDNGKYYKSARALGYALGISRRKLRAVLKAQGFYIHDGVKYWLKNPIPVESVVKPVHDFPPREDEAEYQNFRKYKDVESLPFKTYNFEYCNKTKGNRYAVALFSDAHIEETVVPSSVLNLNEYNLDIAKLRIKKYFENLSECLRVDNVDELIFASLGDTISGYIHEELAQCNGLTPIEATLEAQSIIFGGLKYVCETTNLKSIKFIGIVGNHSRITKKIQHANGFKMSYEYIMYKNIESQSKMMGLPIEFCIPESELAVVNTPDNKTFVFCHGYQIKGGGNGTVCGIYPALNRLALKWGKVLKQDKIYLGHFHQCVSINNAVVNGSIIGYNSFALTNGMLYEEPAQMYEVFDSNIGHLLTRKIYCK